MNLIKLLLVAALCTGAYKYWQQHHDGGPPEGASANGFIDLPTPRGPSRPGVLVIAAENCPQEDAQRADRLAEDLRRAGVPVSRIHQIGWDAVDGQDELDRINQVMRGPLPIVFVRGRAKANPSADEVVAEFNGPA